MLPREVSQSKSNVLWSYDLQKGRNRVSEVSKYFRLNNVSAHSKNVLSSSTWKTYIINNNPTDTYFTKNCLTIFNL